MDRNQPITTYRRDLLTRWKVRQSVDGCENVNDILVARLLRTAAMVAIKLLVQV